MRREMPMYCAAPSAPTMRSDFNLKTFYQNDGNITVKGPLRIIFPLSIYDGMSNVIFMIQLSTREVEKIVAHVFGVPENDKLALRARLENLRKKGCPHGLVTGRGKVARFDFEQLTDVSVALALIDAGLSPDYAVSAIEDTDGAIRECFALLARQKPSSDDLNAAVVASWDDCVWPGERLVTASCNMHRLLSGPRDEAYRVATWVVFEPSSEMQPMGVGLSAVHIDFGTLFVKLVKAIAHITGVEGIALALDLLARAEDHVVHP